MASGKKRVGTPPVKYAEQQVVPSNKLTKLERQARREASQSIRVATSTGFSSVGNNAGNIANADSSFYSPQISTDFLELPQSEREKRELFRFWYTVHPIVGAAIDFHTDVPMSKIRLSLPKGKDVRRNKQILNFYEEMTRRLNLFQVLYDTTHEYWLHGLVHIFAEDHDLEADLPENLIFEVKEETIGEVDHAGRTIERTETTKNPLPDDVRDRNIKEFAKTNYKGWQRLQILPPEQVRTETFQFTNSVRMELIPSEKDRLLVQKAQDSMDVDSMKIAQGIPSEIRENLLSGKPIPLNTDPYQDFLCSSFCHTVSHKKSPYEEKGKSILERCLRTLLYQDKLRQAQTSIATRAMTPKRIVWAEGMSEIDVDNVRDQVDQALIDPDFTIVTNFELHWDEIGSRDRLLDLGTEYEITNKLLYIGLRITESMLTGESTYSGERIHLDVMNTMYLLYRETISQYVEEKLFAPVAVKKGFVEEDEYGNQVLLYPKLQFTRLALRDNTEMMDTLFQLYQKGSLPVSKILELLNLDSDDIHDELKRDSLTHKDANFNELLRNMLGDAGGELLEKSNVVERLAKELGLKLTSKEDDRFGKE